MDEFLAKHDYAGFFDSMRLTRIESQVQVKVLCALETHMKEATYMAKLQKIDPSGPIPGRCNVIAEVIQFHNKVSDTVRTGLGILLKLAKDE